MAPHLGTFLILMKVSEKFKKMCLPWPRIWAGPCYRMPRYYIHETIRLFLVLVVFYQVWFQFWYAIGLVLVLGYGYKEHRVKRNIIPALMLVMGVMFYVVCWCGLFGRKQDGSHAAAQRGDAGGNESTRNQDNGDEAGGSGGDQDTNDNNAGGLRRRVPLVNNNNTNNENDDDDDDDDVTAVKTAITPAMAMADLIRNAKDVSMPPPSSTLSPSARLTQMKPCHISSAPNLSNLRTDADDFSDAE